MKLLDLFSYRWVSQRVDFSWLPIFLGRFFRNRSLCSIIYRRKYPNAKALGDITAIQPRRDLPKNIDVEPFEAFSIAGKRRGFDDTRGILFEIAL